VNSELPKQQPAIVSATRFASSEGHIPTCWNSIGVYGNGSCEELAQFVHCRNCPVYSKAAALLLDRVLPEGYRRVWTLHYAQEKTAAKPARISALLFRLNNEWLGLPTQAFQEVAERRPIHSLPHRRQALVLGLANVRGELVICVSLNRALGVESAAPQPNLRILYDRLLVARWDGHRLAFPVDEVHGIQHFDLTQLKPAPAVVSKASHSYSRGVLQWQQRTVGFLNAELLFGFLNRSLA
jgi:chemotaxis-related protein WspD